MKKTLLSCLLVWLPIALVAKPYYSEYTERRFFRYYTILFHGNIAEENEPLVRILEQHYLEHRGARPLITQQLRALGVGIEVIFDVDRRRALRRPHPPEFHHYHHHYYQHHYNETPPQTEGGSP